MDKAKRDHFDQVLKVAGHYPIEEPSEQPPEQIRHFTIIGRKVTLCGIRMNNNLRRISIPDFVRDVNCPKCRKAAGIEGWSITKRSLMTACAQRLADIEIHLLEVYAYNLFYDDNMNPDPDGELASEWLRIADELIAMVERCRAPIERLETSQGWPDIVQSTKEHEK